MGIEPKSTKIVFMAGASYILLGEKSLVWERVKQAVDHLNHYSVRSYNLVLWLNKLLDIYKKYLK